MVQSEYYPGSNIDIDSDGFAEHPTLTAADDSLATASTSVTASDELADHPSLQLDTNGDGRVDLHESVLDLNHDNMPDHLVVYHDMNPDGSLADQIHVDANHNGIPDQIEIMRTDDEAYSHHGAYDIHHSSTTFEPDPDSTHYDIIDINHTCHFNADDVDHSSTTFEPDPDSTHHDITDTHSF